MMSNPFIYIWHGVRRQQIPLGTSTLGYFFVIVISQIQRRNNIFCGTSIPSSNLVLANTVKMKTRLD